MGWQRWRVGVEYDGPQHWTDPAVRAHDIDRSADLARDGWTIIRVSRDILRYRPEVFLTRAAMPCGQPAGRDTTGSRSMRRSRSAVAGQCGVEDRPSGRSVSQPHIRAADRASDAAARQES